jgi:hypothetical protein
MELIPMLIEAIRELDDRTLARFTSLTKNSTNIQVKPNSLNKVEEMKVDVRNSNEIGGNIEQNTKIDCADLISIVKDMKNRIAALDNIKTEILSKLNLR